MTALAGTTFAALVALVVAFQAALVLGAPWGHLTMGGQHPGALPLRLRLLSALQALVLVGLAGIVLARAGLAFAGLADVSRSLIWVAAGVSGLSFVLNLMTPSMWERRLWAPVTLLMLISSLVVAST